MNDQIPDREMIERLRQIHKAKGDRGPIAIDSRALGRVQRMMEKSKASYRQLIKPQTPSELSAQELNDAIAAIVCAYATIRMHGDELLIESTEPIDRAKIPLAQAIAGEFAADGRQTMADSIQSKMVLIVDGSGKDSYQVGSHPGGSNHA